MPTGDPMCACGCGAWLGQCRGTGPLVPFGPPPMPGLQASTMSVGEAIAKHAEAMTSDERAALAQSLVDMNVEQAREERRAFRPAFAKWLKKTRYATRYTQLDVARAMGLGRPAYVNYEAGKQSCTLEMFLLLCRFLGADPVDALREILEPQEEPD